MPDDKKMILLKLDVDGDRIVYGDDGSFYGEEIRPGIYRTSSNITFPDFMVKRMFRIWLKR